MSEDDEFRARHMLDAAREAIVFAKGRSSQDLRQDRMFLLSVVKEIEIIGEAAARMSTAGQAAIPEIPWPQVVAMRNQLTHAYFNWDTERIWDTLVSDLPRLVSVLETAFSRLD